MKVFFILLLLISQFSYADDDKSNVNYTKFVIENYDKYDFVAGYVFGLGEGIVGSNITKKRKEICRPIDLSLNADDYLSILRAYYTKIGRDNKLTSVTMYFALKDIYPCN